MGYNSSNVYALQELYYSGGWGQGSPPNMEGYLSATRNSVAGDENVIGWSSGTNMQIDRGIDWVSWNTTALTGTNCNEFATTAAYDASGYPVYFCASNGEIWTSYNGNTPVRISFTGFVAPEVSNSWPANSPLAGFSDGTNCHLFYIGTDSHVHELYSSSCSGSTWSTSDLTVSSGTNPAGN